LSAAVAFPRVPQSVILSLTTLQAEFIVRVPTEPVQPFPTTSTLIDD